MANGKAEKIESKEWAEFQAKLAEFNRVAGSLLFLPVILIVGAAYGLRAGLIAGASKAIQMFQEWGE